ncbi:MAG: HesA/MoeB/ThiF family protein [Planctomycetota bacterium]|nr:HesA/MoeB/ThiF family protein [Planctomycetota bacterium]
MRSMGQLTDEQRAIYEWQMWSPDFGESGQQKLAAASVLVTRVGGLGGTVAYQLAAAGVGRLVLAHAGEITLSDLNRQILMTRKGVGSSRVESARRRLLELNPQLDVVVIAENANHGNAGRLTDGVDVIVDCCPRFEERFALNAAALRSNTPLVECAMYDLEGSIYTVLPGRSACVRCLFPDTPPKWKRQFPAFGAVASMMGSIGAMEAIKILAGFGETTVGNMLRIDLRSMIVQQFRLQRNPACPACAGIEILPPTD